MSNGTDETLAATSTPSLEGGERIAGRYRVDGLLGVGGMGRVYRVLDEDLDEQVALKMLRPELLESTEALERFRIEVKLARRVTHRNVARIFDIGEQAGQRFMTMELVDGSSLADELARRGRLSVDEAIPLLLQICEGLAAAHEAGIIHRDLKPGNVMIERGGRIVVTDFGLARHSSKSDSELTMGQVVGTPAYMAPEQVEASEIGPTADVYALGLIAYEVLSGQAAWRGSSPVLVAAKRLFEPPPKLHEARPDVPPELDALVARCLERAPDKRPASAAELLAALRACRPGASGDTVAIDSSELARRHRDTKVAVLAFRNLGGEADEATVRGLTEDLGDVLSMTNGLRVRHAIGDDDRDPLIAGRELGVDVVVVGTVRRHGERLRVSARMLGVEDGFQVWASRFERPFTEALALNDELGRAVAQALAAAGPEGDRPVARAPGAAEVYLELRDHMRRTFRGASRFGEFRQHLDRALASAPDDPLILAAWLGYSSRLTFFEKYEEGPEVSARLQKVLTLAPGLASSWHAKAAVEFYGRKDPAAAVTSLRQALRRSPGHADSQSLLAFLLGEADMLDHALEHARRGFWADPTLPWARANLMHVHALLGQWDNVLELARASEAPSWHAQGASIVARYSLWCGRWLAPDDLPEDTAPDLRAQFELSRRVFNREVDSSHVDVVIAQFIDRAHPESRAFPTLRQQLAEGAAYLGDDARALDLITQATAHGLLDLAWFDRAPVFERLRGTPAFAEQRAIVAARADKIRRAYEAPLD